jgi:putative peptidoglycan lipid II flippase
MAHVFSRAFYARKEAMTPVLVSLCMVALNLALNITLIFTPLREAGLAWSTALCSILQSIVLAKMLSKRVPGIIDHEVAVAWVRTALATAVMAAATYGVGRLLPSAVDAASLALGLVTKVAVAGAVFALMSSLLRMPELGWVLRRGSTTSTL